MSRRNRSNTRNSSSSSAIAYDCRSGASSSSSFYGASAKCFKT
jgi:hypothetical protein